MRSAAVCQSLMRPSFSTEIPEEFRSALESVLTEIETITDPVGIMLTGSVVQGTASATSDLDVAILHDANWRQRIQRVAFGRAVEVFINSEAWWKRTLETEAASGRSPAAHFLSEGIIIADQDDRMLRLQEKARIVREQGPKVSAFDLTQLKYAAVSTLEDGVDLAASDVERSRWLLLEAMDKAVRFHYSNNGIWIPREKDLFIDVEQRWAEKGHDVRSAFSETQLSALRELATSIVRACTGDTRFFEWSSPRQELDSQ